MLKIGGASETEVNELKDRVNDAICATKAALAEGIVPGGGVALLYSSKALDSLKFDNPDIQCGVNIVKEILMTPCINICNNAGYTGVLIASQLLDEGKSNMGFDASQGVKCDMIKAGIIDPTKVVRTAIVSASKIASLMLTTEGTIIEEAKKEDNSSSSNNNSGMYDDEMD